MSEKLRALIRSIPDFPKEGILFRDITPLLMDPAGMKETTTALAEAVRGTAPTKVICVESRGFIFGAPVAMELGVGMIPARKPGKLPGETVSEEYDLEYGTATLEIHTDAVQKGDRVVLIDDLLATGGTARAAIRLVEKLGGEVLMCAFVIELAALRGRAKLEPVPVSSLIIYD